MSKPVEVEKENAERWVLSYADLVTLLLGFFIILFATAEIDVHKFQAIAHGLAVAFNVEVTEGAEGGSAIFDGGTGIIPEPSRTISIQSEQASIRERIEARSEERGIEPGQIIVTGDEESVIIRLADSLLFPSASAAIRPDALALLDVIGSVVAELPNEIRVEGHTDNVPVGTARYPTNWELSSARATAVLRYLVEHAGVAANRAFAAGYGEHRPEASNLTPEGRALNRRADIVVMYPPASLIAEEPTGPVLGQE